MFSTKLRNLRREKKLTQAELGKILNVSNGTIAMWETDKRQPDINTVAKIANYFNVSIDFLFDTKTPQIISLPHNNTPEISNNKKQLIEMVKELNEDDVLIATGIIARLNNKSVEEIFKQIKR